MNIPVECWICHKTFEAEDKPVIVVSPCCNAACIPPVDWEVSVVDGRKFYNRGSKLLSEVSPDGYDYQWPSELPETPANTEQNQSAERK